MWRDLGGWKGYQERGARDVLSALMTNFATVRSRVT